MEECYGVYGRSPNNAIGIVLRSMGSIMEALCAQGISMCGMSLLGGKTIVKAIELPRHPEFTSKPF